MDSMTRTTLFFTWTDDGTVPEPNPLVCTEEFDLELTPTEADDLVFRSDKELYEWLLKGEHKSAKEFIEDYGTSPHIVFIGAFSMWRGEFDFIDPRWAKHANRTII